MGFRRSKPDPDHIIDDVHFHRHGEPSSSRFVLCTCGHRVTGRTDRQMDKAWSDHVGEEYRLRRAQSHGEDEDDDEARIASPSRELVA